MSNTRRTTPPKGRPTTPRARQSKPKEPVLTFMGEEYRLADKIGIWPMMQFARAAEAGLSLSDNRGLAAAHAMLEDIIDPEDWGRFQEDMIKSKLMDLSELIDACNQATELIAQKMARAERARPTPPAQREISPARASYAVTE